MAVIRPHDLPASAGVNPAASLVVDDGATVEKATPIQVVDAAIPLASQAEAEAGADNVKRMSPLRVKQLLDANFSTGDLFFTQTGTGAVTRLANSKMGESLSVLDFIPIALHADILDGTSTDDVTSYIVAALDAATGIEYSEREVVWPAGKYCVSRLNLRDRFLLHLHALGTVQIVGIDETAGYILGDDRFDELGHTENYTRYLRMTGGPWLIAPLAGQDYQRGMLLQNFADCEFHCLYVSGVYVPAGGTGDRASVELELSFNNSFYDSIVGSPGTPIGADKSYNVYLGNDNANNNRFYNWRSAGLGGDVANTIGIRVASFGNSFYGGDISAIHTAFELNNARGFLATNVYHESVSRIVNVEFASSGCTFHSSYADIIENGTAYDLGGTSGTVQTIGFVIIGGTHIFDPVGTTGLKKGTNCYALTYLPAISTTVPPAVAKTGLPSGSGGTELLDGSEMSTAQVNFPDVPMRSTGSTTFDGYLESSPTPGIKVGATAQTVTGSARAVLKAGECTVTGSVVMAGAVSGTGNVKITLGSLAFTPAVLGQVGISPGAVTWTGFLNGTIGTGSTDISVWQTDPATGTRTALTHANLGATSEFQFSVTFRTAE